MAQAFTSTSCICTAAENALFASSDLGGHKLRLWTPWNRKPAVVEWLIRGQLVHLKRCVTTTSMEAANIVITPGKPRTKKHHSHCPQPPAPVATHGVTAALPLWTDHRTSHINGPTDGNFLCLDSFNQPQVFLRFIHTDVHVNTSLPRERDGSPLQYPCLGNPMDRGAWWATVHEVTRESDVTSQLNNHPCQKV